MSRSSVKTAEPDSVICEEARERLATIIPLLEEAMAIARAVHGTFPREEDDSTELLEAVLSRRTQPEPLWMQLRYAASSMFDGEMVEDLSCSVEFLHKKVALTQADIDEEFRQEVEEREAKEQEKTKERSNAPQDSQEVGLRAIIEDSFRKVMTRKLTKLEAELRKRTPAGAVAS